MNPEIVRALATLEADPDNADALASLAQLTEGGGNGHGRGAAEPASTANGGDTAVRRALAESRRIHRERGDFELLVRLIDLELGVESDKSRRADLYYEKGKLLADELLREEEAVSAFTRVLELRPDDEGTQDTLGHIALVRDNWQKIVKKYLEEAKGSTDRQLTTSLYLSVAEIYAKYQPDDNVELYLKKALEVEPRNLKASYRLERLYRGEQRWEELNSVYEQRIEAGATKEERVLAYLALAELQTKKLGKRTEAAESYKKALGLDPANQRALSALVEWYTVEENWQALIRVYENALRARPRGEPETAMYLQIGMLWWKKLGNLESADEYWKKVRKAEPAHPAMLEFYRALYANDGTKLLAVLGQAQKVEPDARRRAELGVEMAMLAERSAGAAEKAIDLWKGVLKVDPAQPDAVHALKRLYQKTEKWNALLELLKEGVEALPKDDVEGRVGRLMEVVAIYRDKLNLDVMVINTFNHILTLKPDHRDALAALAGKYEALGRWNDLIGVLQRTVDVSPDAGEKTRLLRRIAGLWIEKFSNHNQAVKPLEELYAIDPADVDTVGKLRDIYGKRRSWRALLDLERKELERLKTPQEQRAKLGEMAKLAADRLGDAREAIAIWNRVLEVAPPGPAGEAGGAERSGHYDAEALQALSGLYERDRRWAALIETLRRQAHAPGLELKLQVTLLEKVGSLFAEKLANPDKAVSAYQEILALMPSHTKAMRTLRELYAAAGRFGELEALYAGQGQFEELCEILTSVAERASDPAERMRLYTRVAEIAQQQLKSPERAAKAYERILAIAGDGPEAQPAALALLPIYRASEKWARLLTTYEILLNHKRGDEADAPGLVDERLALHRQIIELCEQKLGSKSQAFAWAAKAYQLRPTDAGLQRDLERLAAEAEAWEELAEIYQSEVVKESDEARKTERFRQLARIALTRLYKPDEARKYFEEVLQRAPEDAEALGNLEQIFTQAGNYKELLAIYKKREARATDPQRRLEMLFKVAWIEEEQLGDPGAAIGTYRRILESDQTAATQMRALRALEKLYAGRGDASGMAETLTRQLALAAHDDHDTRLELSHRLGELYETNLNDPHKALEHFRAAFHVTATPGAHKPTVSALERWLAAGATAAAPGPGDAKSVSDASSDRVSVARLLSPVYEQRLAVGEGDAAPKLVDALEIVRAAEKDPAAELLLLRRLMDLAATQLGDATRAYAYGGQVFTRAPGDAENRRMMAQLADQLDKPDDWAVQLGVMEDAAAKRGETTLAKELAWDLGQLFDARLGMPSDAEAAYKRVLDRDATNEDAQIALVQLYSINERWQDLRTLLEGKKQRALDTEGRLSLLYQISDLDEGVLDDQPAATRDYVEVLELDPSSQRAFRALERLYTTAESWKALDELLQRRIPFASEEPGLPESRAHLTFRRGELHANRLDDAVGATDLFEDALGMEPRHEGARKGLEALMKRPDLRQRIAKALEPLYRTDEAWPKLALVLGAQREAAEGRDAAALLAQLAELQEEKLGARQLALTTWREALRLDPADKRTRDNVERLAVLLGRQAELAAAWEEAFLASDPDDLRLRGELLEKAAELYEDDLKDIDRARATWRRLLDLDPTNLHTARPAAAALARLYETAEDWRSLIDVLHRQAEWAATPGEKKDLLFRIGLIEEELLVDPAAAIGTYREILDDDATDLRALDALEKLHQALGQWLELVDVLRRRLELTSEPPAARRDLMWRIAQLNERELGDGGEAIAGYHAILDEQPQDLPALDALARLYEAQSRPADLLEILEQRLALALEHTEAAQTTRLRLQIAGIDDGFGRRDQALERYREVLDSEPRNSAARAGVEKYLDDPDLRLRAAEVLEPHYQVASELDKQIQLAELWAQHAPDPRERITRLMQIASLKERAGDAEAAFDAFARAARIGVGEPELPALLDGIERLATAAARPKLVALYRELGPDILDASTQERVYLAVAAESHKLGDRETAREYYRRVIDMSPDHPKALDALEGIYVEGREWDPLYEVYVRRAELAAGDDDRRRHYLMQLAQLCAGPESPLDRPLEAIRAYEQVLEMFPTDVEAGQALEARYVAAHRHSELAELYEKRLGFCDDVDEAVALRFRLAQLYDEDLSDSDRAVENYRAALGGDPTHAGAIRALEKYLDDDGQRVSAAEVLEPTYVARHDWPSLVRIYQIRLEAADDPKTRLMLTKRIARLYEEQLEDLEGAFTWYARVFREEPSDRAIRDQLARLAGILDGWAKLAEVYEAYLADEGAESAVGHEVLRGTATIYHARLEDVDKAKASYERLLELDPADQVAFGNLELLLGRARRFNDLLQVYRDAADGTLDMARKKALLYKQAALQENELADAEGAVDSWRAVLDFDGDDDKAIASLERLYRAGGRWHDLVELTLRGLERVEVGQAAYLALKLRLGVIYEQELSDLPSAIDVYEEVLGHSSGHPDAVRALERLIVDHDHTFRIAQILEPIYRAEDAWQKLVVIYDAELEFIDDKPRRIELLQEIARIHEKRGGDPRLAFGALARAWSEEAGEPDAVERETALYHELKRLGHMLRMWRELVGVLQEAVADSYDYDLQGRVHARVADIQETQLGDRAAAIDSWRKVVGVRDDDDQAWRALERLLADEGRNRELVQVLEKRAGLSNDLREQKDLAYRTAELYEGPLGETDSAIGTWRHVLTLDDTDHAALDALERLYFLKGSFRELTSILTTKIEQTHDPKAQRPLRLQLAKLSESELHDALAAIDAYKGILGNDPADQEALEAVARLYAAEGLWADHLEALDALAEAAGTRGDAGRKVELELKAAQVLEREVGDAESAIGRYRNVLFAGVGGPPEEGAKAALEKLVRDEATREPAAAVLEPYYEQQSDFAALIDVTELRLQAESEPQERRRLLSRIAELNEAGIEDLQAAFSAWGRVLGEDAGDEAAQVELERLAELTQAPGELARVYEERMAAAFDPEVQRALALKLGHIYESKLGDEERAISAYNKALDLPGPDGSERIPLQALDRLLARAARWRDLGDVLEKEASAVNDPVEQAEFFYRLGALRAGELVDLDGALLAYRDAIQREPSHAPTRAGLEKLLASHAHAEAALEVLEPLYEQDENWQKVVQLSEVRLGITSGHPEQAQLLETIAERCERYINDAAKALDAMARALRLRPDEPRLADEVERLGEAAGEPRRAADTFEAVLDAPGAVSGDQARDLGLRTARLWERLQDDARAEARYLFVLEVDGENGEALEALERLYRVRNDHAQLAHVLERRAAVDYDTTAKRRLFAEAAELHEKALGDVPAAIAGWQKVLDVDDGDVGALDALARLHEKEGHFTELVGLLAQKARIEEDPRAQVELKSRIAAIWAEKIGDLDRAVDAYRDLLDHAPDSPAALDALEALERRRGDWTAVQEVLVRQLQAVTGPRQIPVYKKLVALAVDKHDSADDAIGYLHEILTLQADEPEANAQLAALLEKSERYNDLIDVLTDQANRRAAAGDSAGEIALLVRAADVWEGRLGNAEASTEILERILERDPSNVRALMSLAHIYEAARDVDKARATLERAVELAETTPEGQRQRAELHFRIGKIEAEAGDEEAGEGSYLRALDADSEHAGALAALEKLARGRGDWSRVAELLALRLEQTAEADRKPLYIELAQVYGDKLKQPDQALPYLEQLARVSPDEPTVLEPLADLYFAAGRDDDALPLYRKLAERLGKGKRTRDLARLNQRIGAIAERKGDTKLALEHYQTAFSIDPQHTPTMIALGKLHAAEKEWEKARRIYRQMLLQNLDPASGVSKADVYLHLGEIHEQLGEAPKAVGMFERGLEVDGQHAALRQALGRVKPQP